MILNKKIHYGWWVAIGCLLMLMYSLGLTISISSVLLTPLIDTLGLTKAQGSSIMSIQNLSGVAFMLIGGGLYARYNIRRFCLFFGLLIAAGYVVFSAAGSIAACYAAAFLIGSGYGGSSMIPISILMTRWFHHQRGIAMGIAVCGSGIATIIFPPVIAVSIEAMGLSAAYLVLAASSVALSLSAFAFVQNYPSDMGLSAFGSDGPSRELTGSADVPGQKSGISVKEAIRTPRFYVLLPAMFMAGSIISPVVMHIAAHLSLSGYPAIFASTALSVYGFVMMLGKPLYGAIIDKLGGYLSNYYIYALMMAALTSALFVSRSIAFVYLFVVFLGLGAPLGTMLPSFVVIDFFGDQDYSQLLTIVKVVFTLGGSFGALLPGLIADSTGYYTGAFAIFLAFAVCSLTMLQVAYKRSGSNRGISTGSAICNPAGNQE